MKRRTTFVVSATLALQVITLRAEAQSLQRVAASAVDQSIAAGRLADAETELFEQARRAPREPSVRGALGMLLAGRGKLLVGAVLLEEAMRFGGDSMAIETRLFEIYRWAGQYARAGAQQRARVAPELREAMTRAATLQVSGLDSAAVPLLPNELFGIGRITAEIAGERVELDVQPYLTGVMLPASLGMHGAVERSGARGDTTFAVARSISIGGVVLGQVPVMLVPQLPVGRIGLDVLGRLRPTFDAAAKVLTLRSVATAAAPTAHVLPLLLTFPGVSFVPPRSGSLVTLNTAAGRAALRGIRWTLNVDGGVIVIER